MKILNTTALVYMALWCISCQSKQPNVHKNAEKFPYQGWNILSSHKENGLKTLDKAAEYGVNHIELSHYQLCHDLKDLRNAKSREATNFLVDAAHERGIEDVYVWDHAFYGLDYYPDSFKVEAQGNQDFTHHTTKFEGGLQQQLNLDDPEFWKWVYNDYDFLLALSPNLDGIVLTFIETGSYVIYQHSDKLKTKGQKLAALVDSLGNYFIDEKDMKLTIRTFIYNQFEKDVILEALQLIKRKDLTVMIKMVPHDWFLTYPYQDYVSEIPFPVVIEYDAGMEYAGENIIANSFPHYFADAFKHYAQYENVVGYCARADRFEETTAVGTPGELNLYVLSELAKNKAADTDSLTRAFIAKNYGEETVQYLQPAFDSAFSIIMASMYTLGTHTANHSRLNFHRKNIYQSHTTGEWYAPDDQMRWVGHGVNRHFHNYKDVINTLAPASYKTDTAGLKKDIAWVLDSAWLSPTEEMTRGFLDYIITEKSYAVDLAEDALAKVEKALPMVKDTTLGNRLHHTFKRTVLFAKERRAAAIAFYGYRLWEKGKEYQTEELKQLVIDSFQEADSSIAEMENYPVHVPLGQWRWHRDREAFEIYKEECLLLKQ